MSDTNTTPNTLHNAVCMHCGYDISGLQPNERGLVTCPECGMQLRYNRSVEALTAKYMHSRFAARLLLPTCLVPFTTMLCACVPGINILVMMGMFVVALALSCILWMNTTPDLVRQAEIHPRTIPQWRVVLWSILYLLPQIGIAIVYMHIVTTYFMVYV
tara:strand:- start:303 stop:779 length:477 start_codon:yes stop_codon:yes gene_type:complete